MIRNGFYCGRRFDAGDHEAVWFIEEDELKIADSLGQNVVVLNQDEITAMAEQFKAQGDQVAAEYTSNASDSGQVNSAPAATADQEAGSSQDSTSDGTIVSLPLPAVPAIGHQQSEDNGDSAEQVRRAA